MATSEATEPPARSPYDWNTPAPDPEPEPSTAAAPPPPVANTPAPKFPPGQKVYHLSDDLHSHSTWPALPSFTGEWTVGKSWRAHDSTWYRLTPVCQNDGARIRVRAAEGTLLPVKRAVGDKIRVVGVDWDVVITAGRFRDGAYLYDVEIPRHEEMGHVRERAWRFHVKERDIRT